MPGYKDWRNSGERPYCAVRTLRQEKTWSGYIPQQLPHPALVRVVA
jgi:hypothetical protein